MPASVRRPRARPSNARRAGEDTWLVTLEDCSHSPILIVTNRPAAELADAANAIASGSFAVKTSIVSPKIIEFRSKKLPLCSLKNVIDPKQPQLSSFITNNPTYVNINMAAEVPKQTIDVCIPIRIINPATISAVDKNLDKKGMMGEGRAWIDESDTRNVL
jgi:hypothetical protein